MKRWLLFLPVVLFGCPQFAPDDVCGYPGFCDGSVGDSGKDGPTTCPSGKEPKDDPSCVTDALGIFLAPTPGGSDANAGTKASPVATLKTALQKAKGGKSFIFVCEGSYTESVDITQSISIFGGFKCADWSYSGTQAKFTATKPDYVLHLDGANGTIVGDLEFDAIDGAANKGESSVAVIANATAGRFERVAIVSGAGSNGASGVLNSFTNYPSQTTLNGNSSSGPDGGAPNAVLCPAGDTSTGGKGGDNGFDGLDGLPGPSNKGTVAGCSGSSAGGGKGATGGNGADGDGGAGGTLGASGWSADQGATGKAGGPGQGGGGGGGYMGGGGGSGGAGGCGGAGGANGQSGGSSIGIISTASTLKLSQSTITVKGAGNGGVGTTGQTGQAIFGFHGNGFGNGCQGGAGGPGGNGGSGGGGAGGLCVGVFYKGTKPDTTDQTTISVPNQGGSKGVGGSAGANDGVDGVVAMSLECTPPSCL